MKLTGRRFLKILDIENTTDDYIQFWKFYIPPGRKTIDLASMPDDEYKDLCIAVEAWTKNKTDGLVVHSMMADKHNWADYLKPAKRTIFREDGSELKVGTEPATIDGKPV